MLLFFFFDTNVNTRRPSKELNRREVSRIVGLSEHMLHLSIQQRQLLLGLAKQYPTVNSFCGLVASLSSTEQTQFELPPQATALAWMQKQKVGLPATWALVGSSLTYHNQHLLGQLIATLKQLLVLCEAVNASPAVLSVLNQQLKSCQECKTALSESLGWHWNFFYLLDETAEDGELPIIVTQKAWAAVVHNFASLRSGISLLRSALGKKTLPKPTS